MGFINTPKTETNKQEVKTAESEKKKKITTPPKKKMDKYMKQTTTNSTNLIVYTLDQAAEIIHVSKRTLFNYIKAGIFPAVKVGKSWLITEEKLRDFVEKGTE